MLEKHIKVVENLEKSS